MSALAYFTIGGLIAAYFGLDDAFEPGDWPKGAGVIVMCALWPVMIGLGIGLMLGSIFRAALNLFATLRGDS